MNQTINANRLFLASCFALITTALSFSIRAGILPQLQAKFSLDSETMGVVNSMWFFGFPISMIFFGIFYAKIGPKIIMRVAFLAHTAGIIATVYAPNLYVLLIAMLLIGIGNGCTEAACNPMIADSYSGNEFHSKLNKFHMWFPGGIVLGSLITEFMTKASFNWEIQFWVIMIPTVIYAIMFWGQAFPQPKADASSPIASFKAMLNPLYLFMAACMALTAISEFGPEQWIKPILSQAGVSPMLILALTAGLMAVGRYFGGPLVQKFNTAGVLLGSAIFTLIGIYMLSTMFGPMLYIAAVVYALGICYFWPNMLGYIGQHLPQTGALGLSVIGGVGMFSTAIFNPIIGGWITDNHIIAEKDPKVRAGIESVDLVTGQATLSNMLIFPGILIVAFALLYFMGKKKQAA
jgi:putative MFS transporter